MRWLLIALLLLAPVLTRAQFSQAAGQAGSTAVHKDSSLVVAWASDAVVNQGWVQITDTTLGRADVGLPESSIGPANGDVISLGDGGIATLFFEYLIRDGNGPDLAVFENSFSDNFLELALVSVSSNGQDYFTFPATSFVDATEQIDGFGEMEPSLVHNLAGKYRATYGTPFDLADLPDTTALNKDSVSWVRVQDVVGSIDSAYGSFDYSGRIINDPFPTPYGSGGFDLDAVGVLNVAGAVASLSEPNSEQMKMRIDPLTSTLHYEKAPLEVRFYTASGTLLSIAEPSGRSILIPEYKGILIIHHLWTAQEQTTRLWVN